MSNLSVLLSTYSNEIVNMKFDSSFTNESISSNDVSHLKDIVDLLFSTSSLETGILPPGVLFFNNNIVVFEKPPTQKNITYHPYMIGDIPQDSIPKLITIAIPWQVYIVIYAKDPQTSKMYPVDVYMFFRNSQILSKDDPVYLAPLSNFYANGKLCRPFFESFDDIDRYDNTIAGVVQAAYDWVWSSNTNVDLTATIAEYYISYQNDRNTDNLLIFDYFTDKRSSVRDNVHSSSFYVNSSIVNYFYKYWSRIPFSDIINVCWSNPAYNERYLTDEETYYDFLMDHASHDMIISFLEDHDFDFEEYEIEDTSFISLRDFDYPLSDIIEYFGTHPRLQEKSLQDVLHNISIDSYLSPVRTFKKDFSAIQNILSSSS
jgi:hypothetical protein